MNKEAVYQKVTEVMVELFDLDRSKISPESKFVEDLDLTSLDAIDLVVQLEEFVGKKVGEKELLKVRTVGDICALIEGSLAAPKAEGA
jgi:acyl carrier protein